MRIRTVLSGILAGAICFPLLWFQYYRIAPAQFVPGWGDGSSIPPLPNWTSTAILIFCGITIFSFGWVSARWNWARNWRSSLLAGAGAGALAGCLLYDFIGAFWLGLKGQAEILGNFHTPLTETEGTRILVEAIFKTGFLMYTYPILIITGGALLGALGGLFSAWVDGKDHWGHHPRRPDGWLSRLSAYTLVASGILSVIVTTAVLSLLWEKTMNSALKLSETNEVHWTAQEFQIYFHFYGYVVGLLSILLPMAITWGWFVRNWQVRHRPGVLPVLWMIASLGYTVYYLANHRIYSQYSLVFMLSPLLLAAAALLGFLIGLLADLNESDGTRPTFADWLGHVLAFSIFAATQFVTGVASFSVALALILIVNIPHLVRAEVVEKSPVQQVVQWYGFQQDMALGMLVIGLILALILTGLTAIFRYILRVKELPVAREAQPSYRHTAARKNF